MLYCSRKYSMAMPQSLKTQKPAALFRVAWCNPAIGVKTYLQSPFIMRSIALSVVPATVQVDS